MSKHTPGPWEVSIDDCGRLAGRPGIFAPDELDCAVVHWDGFVQEFWRSARGDKEIQANARLIAAAPEMLEALELANAALSGANMNLRTVEQKVRAAIAKATGAASTTQPAESTGPSH